LQLRLYRHASNAATSYMYIRYAATYSLHWNSYVFKCAPAYAAARALHVAPVCACVCVCVCLCVCVYLCIHVHVAPACMPGCRDSAINSLSSPRALPANAPSQQATPTTLTIYAPKTEIGDNDTVTDTVSRLDGIRGSVRRRSQDLAGHDVGRHAKPCTLPPPSTPAPSACRRSRRLLCGADAAAAIVGVG